MSARELDVDVLVVGAGPTGLTAACEAIRHGLTVRIVDRKPHRSTYSKALVAHARTLEVFEAMGVAKAVVAQGVPFAALNPCAGARGRARRIDLLELPWGDTAYPYWLSIPQYATERVLEEHLELLGARVDWRVGLHGVREHEGHVEAWLERDDGTSELVRSRWLLGCDGARSSVREQAGLRLRREATGVTFVLADVKTTTELPEDEGHVFLSPQGLLLIVPMPEPGRWRIIAHEPEPASTTIDAEFLDTLIRQRCGLEFGSHAVTWTSRFDLSNGVADRYRSGRVFLAGDAAHVHSPVGGQGLNTGVQDAHNLLWKLAAARDAPRETVEALLDSYDAERRPVAEQMVSATARATGLLTRRSGTLRRVLGTLAPLVLARPKVRARLGRNVGMLEVAYQRGPALGEGSWSGRRMPNPVLSTGGRLHERLDPLRPTWVVTGLPISAVPASDAPGWRGFPVLQLPAEELPDSAVPPVALVRPDRYIATSAATVERAWAAMPSDTFHGGAGSGE
ncbi:2-polyprenyl-6-methoxyphenol hydroxylase-like FAD-dependent oxidoreductase [Saccharomonospora amisosensis]|uniref:2-polyprenyl-6-methoxyphenol hydroxylase-like FAD-dependent oxidoreductase n=1 Tax=Saccharomonospora amisosensis TaxID=1128677 RepID=A0A7X5ZQ63_9PSEU|nr:FAD-dependent monooxygenase [Saccharomonospora amisosensis]NIJ11427.1 2-polyprenyl-6-methoxyphenol hydroxylase-like FAD-dependent oxidoreductase [Saccharomonospora amisosensis]